ncbi:hypothetical protein [Vibrio parahaemolyticus]|uniref:hypothetical protein n=1 Tax=Vibrio parahaemolyticus TaxID=670 RepID=UPI002490C2C7|nr:hypothetical protein [Vibrio parahaemolyticus]
MNREEKLNSKVEEIIYKEIIALPANKKVLGSDLTTKVMLFFLNNLGDSSEQWKSIVNQVLKRLIESEYLYYEKDRFTVHWTLTKGLCFDEWESKMSNNNNEFSIGNINATNVQLGNQNHQHNSINITLSNLVEKVASSDDDEAKSKLKEILENSTVASIVGAGASTLLSLL